MRLLYLIATVLTLTILLFSSLDVEAQTAIDDSDKIKINEYDLGYNALTTTAFTIPKGSLVYQNFNLLINTLEYGITDRLSIAGGLVPNIFANDLEVGGLLFLKYNIVKEESVTISISNLNLIGSSNQQDRFDVIPIFFFNAAINNGPNKFFTLGAGYTLIDNDAFPIFTFGYQNRFSKLTAIIADIWIPILGDGLLEFTIPIPAIGFRFYSESGMTFDIGFPFFGLKVPILKPK